jgi:hydrogenase maturation protein HypF
MNRLVHQTSDGPGVRNDPRAGHSTSAVRVLVRGQVQGLGFRPFVFRLAQRCRLTGHVRNTPAGVLIEVEGTPEDLCRFQEHLVSDAPAAAQIEDLSVETIATTGRAKFVVEASDLLAPPQVRVPRDLATCPACRRDTLDPANRRQGYPFTNCTACGPRYSILCAMPYDRAVTSMRLFPMCAVCDAEYHAPHDRRFHAQPNACTACGPQVALWDREGRAIAGSDRAVAVAVDLLRRGQIVAVKGLGGFQLLVRADHSEAVCRLRQRKNRPSKPLAVMVPSPPFAQAIAAIAPLERRLLQSPQNPIVLVEKRSYQQDRGAAKEYGGLAAEVAPRVRSVGIFLPTTPLHYLLLAGLNLPLVATSGNRSDEPIVTDEREVVRRLTGVVDAFLVHDRPIIRGIDDSVMRVIAGQPMTLRLARGLAPLPLHALEAFAKERTCPPLLATGGHLKNALAMWTGTQAILAQHLGDLDNPHSRSAFHWVAGDLSGMYRCEPVALACDLHPDYYTTQWALAQNKSVTRVQHHHAHAVACMVEYNLLDREVLALTWDGTGYGPDGTIWGGEVLRVQCSGFKRVAALLPFPLPGGELAIRHPGRAAFGLLWLLHGEEALLRDCGLHRLLGLGPREVGVLAAMIRRSVNTPWTSSMGRLFDAVAALVLAAQEVSYEGEAAAWLEAVADQAVTDAYTLPLCPPDRHDAMVGDITVPRGDWRPMLSAILADLASGFAPGIVAARFHNALAQWAAAVVAGQPLDEVVLSGGCFQNRFLTERTLAALSRVNRRVYLQSQIPPGDGGLAVGQLAVAMASGMRVREAAP